MRSCLPIIGLTIAACCVMLSGELYQLREGFSWDYEAIPIAFLTTSAIIGIPSAIILFFRIVGHCLKNATASIVWMAVIIIVGMSLCPPWVRVYRLPNSNIKGMAHVAYAPLWVPPGSGRRSNTGIEIDFARLLLQYFVVACIAGGLLYTVRTSQRSGSDQRQAVEGEAT